MLSIATRRMISLSLCVLCASAAHLKDATLGNGPQRRREGIEKDRRQKVPDPSRRRRGGYGTLNSAGLSVTGMEPALYSSRPVKVPLRSAGTRHECEQVPPHPYWNEPVWTTLPPSPTTLTLGRSAERPPPRRIARMPLPAPSVRR